MSAKARTRPTGVTAELSSVGVTRYVWWGFLATLLVTFGSWGAGAKLTQGSWLPHLHLEWLRFGHGQLLSQVFFWAGLALLLVTWLQLGNVLFKLPHDVLSTKAMLLVTVVWMAPLIIAGPILSRDSYSYLAQGTIQYMGYSAYEVGPNVMNTGDTLNPLYLEVSGDWRNTTTPYGPLHLGLMAGIVALTNGNIHLGIFLIKILCMLSLVGIAWAAGAIASDLHQSQAIAVWIGALNPVVLLHLVGGMHNEAFMVALMGIGLAAAVKGKNLLGYSLLRWVLPSKQQPSWPCLPGVDLGLPVGKEIYKEQSGVEASTRRKVGYFFATAGGGAVFSLATFGVLSYLTGTGLGS